MTLMNILESVETHQHEATLEEAELLKQFDLGEDLHIIIEDETLSELLEAELDTQGILSEARKAGSSISAKDVQVKDAAGIRKTFLKVISDFKKMNSSKSVRYASVRWAKKEGAPQHYNLYTYSAADMETISDNKAIKAQWKADGSCKDGRMTSSGGRKASHTDLESKIALMTGSDGKEQIGLKITPSPIHKLNKSCAEEAAYVAKMKVGQISRTFILDNISTLTTYVKGGEQNYILSGSEKSSSSLETFMDAGSKAKHKTRADLFNLLKELNIENKNKLWSADEERNYIQKKFKTTDFDQVIEKLKGVYSHVIEGWNDETKEVLVISKISKPAIAKAFNVASLAKTPPATFMVDDLKKNGGTMTAKAIKEIWSGNVNEVITKVEDMIKRTMKDASKVTIGTTDITIESRVK